MRRVRGRGRAKVVIWLVWSDYRNNWRTIWRPPYWEIARLRRMADER